MSDIWFSKHNSYTHTFLFTPTGKNYLFGVYEFTTYDFHGYKDFTPKIIIAIKRKGNWKPIKCSNKGESGYIRSFKCSLLKGREYAIVVKKQGTIESVEGKVFCERKCIFLSV